MTENFLEAGLRHLKAADTLFTEDQVQEAAYLGGYVAECALKTLLLNCGWSRIREFSHELPALSGNGLEMALLLSPRYRRYRSLVETPGAWRKWKPAQRYDSDQTGPDQETLYRHTTELGRTLLTALILDGELEIP